MILKIGYQTKDGIITWEYFEGFSELRITPFLKKMYIYHKESGKVFYAPEGTEDADKWRDVTEDFEAYLHPDSINDIMYLTSISFRDDSSGNYNRIVCPSDTLYVMNDNGKTVDRY